jgi:hypothetical protein
MQLRWEPSDSSRLLRIHEIFMISTGEGVPRNCRKADDSCCASNTRRECLCPLQERVFSIDFAQDDRKRCDVRRIGGALDSSAQVDSEKVV